MLSDYSFSDTAGMTKEEAENAVGQQKIWRLLAGPGVSYTLENDNIMIEYFLSDGGNETGCPAVPWQS